MAWTANLTPGKPPLTLKPGDYVSTPGAAFTTVSLALGNAHFTWLPLFQDDIFDSISVVNQSTNATAVTRLGVYADNGQGRPGKLIAEAPSLVNTSVTAGVTKTQAFSADLQLERGSYFLVVQAEVAATSFNSASLVPAMPWNDPTFHFAGFAAGHSGAFTDNPGVGAANNCAMAWLHRK